jgi:hypothetical protein
VPTLFTKVSNFFLYFLKFETRKKYGLDSKKDRKKLETVVKSVGTLKSHFINIKRRIEEEDRIFYPYLSREHVSELELQKLKVSLVKSLKQKREELQQVFAHLQFDENSLQELRRHDEIFVKQIIIEINGAYETYKKEYERVKEYKIRDLPYLRASLKYWGVLLKYAEIDRNIHSILPQGGLDETPNNMLKFFGQNYNQIKEYYDMINSENTFFAEKPVRGIVKLLTLLNFHNFFGALLLEKFREYMGHIMKRAINLYFEENTVFIKNFRYLPQYGHFQAIDYNYRQISGEEFTDNVDMYLLTANYSFYLDSLNVGGYHLNFVINALYKIDFDVDQVDNLSGAMKGYNFVKSLAETNVSDFTRDFLKMIEGTIFDLQISLEQAQANEILPGVQGGGDEGSENSSESPGIKTQTGPTSTDIHTETSSEGGGNIDEAFTAVPPPQSKR